MVKRLEFHAQDLGSNPWQGGKNFYLILASLTTAESLRLKQYNNR